MADFECDYVIVGSGIAALRAAIELSGAGRTLVLTKGGVEQGNTAFAQGGIAAAVGADDSPELHAADTLAAGDGLCRAEAVQRLTELGPRYVRELIDWGARFDCQADGSPALAREAAHSVRRVLHARDATGREISRVLWRRVRGLPDVSIVEQALAVDALVADGRCGGVRFLDERGRPARVSASATLLATGGAGGIFSETTNPPVATGDGIAIAWRAGARVTDLEFMQFHPTALNVAGAPRFLLSEALRGEGAVLVNAAGERFMRAADPAGDLAPRDRVARAIAREAEQSGGPVCLTLEDLAPDFVHRRFPTIAEACSRVGLDLARDRIPVGPAAHYLMGGVAVDTDGLTSVEGLFAAGEVACSGVHGANRLASNSLLEGLVFGAVAGQAMRRRAAAGERRAPAVAPPAAPTAPPAGAPSEREARDLMWREVGLFRDGPRLARALQTLEGWCAAAAGPPAAADAARLASILTVGCLMARAALRREESRGAHFRSDFPERNDPDWAQRVTESRNGVAANDAGSTG